MIKSTTFVTIAALCLGTAAHGATLTTDFSVFARDRNIDSTFEQQTVDLDGVKSRSAVVQDGRATSSASYEVDPVTGVIKIGASSTTAVDVNRGASSRSRSRIILRETFTAVGSGTVTFDFDFDGGIALAGPDGSSNYIATLELWGFLPRLIRVEDDSRAVLGFIGDTLTTTVNGQVVQPTSSLLVNDVISSSLDLQDGQTFNLNLTFQAAAGTAEDGQGGAGASDFVNTGYLDFSTTAGLSVVASDTAFLSNATGRPGTISPSPSVVPLPASLGFLLAGAGMLPILRRARKRQIV